LTDQSFWLHCLFFFGVILARYFLIAGGTYFLFYSFLGKLVPKRGLRLKPPVWNSIKRDIELSVLSGVVFALCAALISKYYWQVTLLYSSLSEYGLWYLGVSYVAVLIFQDMYFYFMHRMFHHPWFFRWLHRGHHYSGDPTPWTSFAFDPLEAILQASFFLIIIFIVPLHFITLLTILMTMTVWAVLNHLGFEVFPPSFPRHWLGRWFIGSTHHSIHHRKYTVHYGLYFTFWDKLLATNDPSYEQEFDSTLRK